MLASRMFQALWIACILGLSWLGMLAVHELGHVLNATLSGGPVVRVVLDPRQISRTDVSPNPHPQFVAWGGAVWGSFIPLGVWTLACAMRTRYRALLTFFAGFCCLANGLYLAAGSLAGVGDAGDLLNHGAARWQLLVVGLLMTATGFGLWHALGPRFGLNKPPAVSRAAAISLAVAMLLVIVLELVFSPW